MILTEENTRELATWMAKVAEKYNKPILIVINTFQEALWVYRDVDLVKLKVVAEFSE